jgi:hypothetical protein
MLPRKAGKYSVLVLYSMYAGATKKKIKSNTRGDQGFKPGCLAACFPPAFELVKVVLLGIDPDSSRLGEAGKKGQVPENVRCACPPMKSIYYTVLYCTVPHLGRRY